MVLAIEPGCYWEGGGGLRVEDNFLITAGGAEKLSPFPDGVVLLVSDLIWTGSLNDPYRIGGHVGLYDTTLRDGEQTVGVVLDPEQKLEIARLLDELGIDRIEAGFPRVSQDDWDAVKLIAAAGSARGGLGLLARRAGRPRGARRARRLVLGDRVADLRPEARRDRRLPREDARADHERDALRRRARHPRGVLRRRLDARRAGLLRRASTRRRSRRARRRSWSSTRSASPRRRRSPSSSAQTVELSSDVPVHFHGHNDFGVATASAVAAVRAGASWVHGTINGMGERAGNANLGEVALTLRALYGVESNLRLDRIREVSARVRELSGYELEPWKPVTGETLYRRESGAVASQFHDPPSIEPYSSELVATERAIVLGKKSGLDSIRIKAEELGLDVPEERRAEVLAAVKELGAEKRGLVTDEEFQVDRWLTTTRSSSAAGVNGLACAALLAKAGWNVCVLERNDWFGGAIKTAEITAPGFHHDVFSAWHPLWVGGPAHAQLGDDLARHGLEYLNTDFRRRRRSRRRERVPAAHGRRQRGRARRTEWGRDARRRSSRTPISRSGSSARSCGRGTARRSR